MPSSTNNSLAAYHLVYPHAPAHRFITLRQSAFKQALLSIPKITHLTIKAASLASPWDSSARSVMCPWFICQRSAVRTHIAVARAVEWVRVGDQKRDETLRWSVNAQWVFPRTRVRHNVQVIPRVKGGAQRIVNDSPFWEAVVQNPRTWMVTNRPLTTAHTQPIVPTPTESEFLSGKVQRYMQCY